MSEARIELASALSKIHALITSVPTIEQKKASAWEYYKAMQVGFDEYGNRRISEALVPHAQRANAIIKAECVAAVEDEFREKVDAVAAELEALRVILPQLAAKACIELGQTARHLKEKADA
jgi:hypothetical protein